MDRIRIILETVSDYMELPESEIQRKTREGEIVFARQICHFFAKELTKLSLLRIAKEIGDMDHATIIHSVKTINNYIDTDKKISLDILRIRKMIKLNLQVKENELKKLSPYEKIEVAVRDLNLTCDRLHSGNISHTKNQLRTIIQMLEL